jgi:hypothetical protein
VEAHEAGQRISWRHGWLLVICLSVPPAVVSPLRLGRRITEAATSGIQAQATPPQARQR